MKNTTKYKNIHKVTIHHHPMGFRYSDGLKKVADQFRCNWLLRDIACYNITSFEPVTLPFQLWTFIKEPNSAGFEPRCNNAEGRVIRVIPIPYSDYAGENLFIILADDILWLPDEYQFACLT